MRCKDADTSTDVDETEGNTPAPSTLEGQPHEAEETPREEAVWGPIAPHAFWATSAGRQVLRTLDTWGQTLLLRATTGDPAALPGPMIAYGDSGRGSPSDPSSSLVIFLDAERAIAKVTTRSTRDFLYAVHGPGTEFRTGVQWVRYFFVDGTVSEWQEPEWEDGEGRTLKRRPNAVRAETEGGMERIDLFRPESYRSAEGTELLRAIGLQPAGVFAMAHRLAAKRIAAELGYP